VSAQPRSLRRYPRRRQWCGAPLARVGHVRIARRGAPAGGNRHGYAGYEFEPATALSLWHVRHRVINSDLGRWMRRDEMGYVDGVHLMAYVSGNPVAYQDPSGHGVLIKEAISSISNSYGSCGSIRCLAGVYLDHPMCFGYTRLIAKITLVTQCDCCSGESGISVATYWENWGAYKPISHRRPWFVDNHTFTLPGNPQSSGVQMAFAEVREFCDPEGQLDVTVHDWLPEGKRDVGRVCCGVNVPADTNMVTFTEPWFWSAFPVWGNAEHAAVSAWNCKCCTPLRGRGCDTTSLAVCKPGPEPPSNCLVFP